MTMMAESEASFMRSSHDFPAKYGLPQVLRKNTVL